MRQDTLACVRCWSCAVLQQQKAALFEVVRKLYWQVTGSLQRARVNLFMVDSRQEKKKCAVIIIRGRGRAARVRVQEFRSWGSLPLVGVVSGDLLQRAGRARSNADLIGATLETEPRSNWISSSVELHQIMNKHALLSVTGAAAEKVHGRSFRFS